MKDPLQSRPARVTAATAAAFASPLKCRILLAFDVPRSISEVAAILGVPLVRVHYHVTRLVRLELLRVERSLPRAGRPIRQYRASAQAYFVPAALLPSPYDGEMFRELRAAVDDGHARDGGGIVFTAGGPGRVDARRVRGSGPAGVLVTWLNLSLTSDEARLLGDELREVMQRYARSRPPARSRRPYMLHAVLAPRRRP